MAKKTKATKTTKTGRKVDKDGFELLGGDNSPMAVGEVVVGEFGGVVRVLPSKRKGGEAVPIYQVGDRSVLGSTVLKSRIEDGNVEVGDTLEITRLEDGTAKKGQSAPKMYKVRVKRAS